MRDRAIFYEVPESRQTVEIDIYCLSWRARRRLARALLRVVWDLARPGTKSLRMRASMTPAPDTAAARLQA